MNDHHPPSPALVLCASSRVSACAEGPEPVVRVSRRGIRWSRCLGPEFSERLEPESPSFCPRLERAARPGETTQSGGGVMMPVPVPVHDRRRTSRDGYLEETTPAPSCPGTATQGRPWSHLVNSQAAAVGHVGRQTDGRHNHNRSVGGSSVSPGRRASHRIRTTGQDQMKTEKKKKERGVPGGAGLQCTAIAPSLFWDVPSGLANQSTSITKRSWWRSREDP